MVPDLSLVAAVALVEHCVCHGGLSPSCLLLPQFEFLGCTT